MLLIVSLAGVYVPTRWVGGEEGGCKITARGGQPVGQPNGQEESFLLRESGTAVPLLASAASAPPTPACPTQSLCQDSDIEVIWRVLTTTDGGTDMK